MSRPRGSKPVRQRGRWRIRWTDSTGKRRSEVYDSEKDAAFSLRRHDGAGTRLGFLESGHRFHKQEE